MADLALSGKTIVITRGSGAIGRVIVRGLVDHRARVAVNDIVPPATGYAVLAESGVHSDPAAHFSSDASDSQAVAILFDRIAQRWGLPDIVCCHAGVVEAHPVDQYLPAAFDRVLDVNLRSAFIVAQKAAQRSLTAGRPGHLIFTSPWVQDVPWPEITQYNASKAGMNPLMRSFARELAPKGIRANAIAPGIVGVGLAARQQDADPNYCAHAQKAIPLGCRLYPTDD